MSELQTAAKELADNLIFGCTPDVYPDDNSVWEVFVEMIAESLTAAYARGRADALKEAHREAQLACGYPPEEQDNCPNHGKFIKRVKSLAGASSGETGDSDGGN